MDCRTNNCSHVESYSFQILSRSLYSGQLGGNHKIFSDKTKIDLVAGYALTKERTDFRRISRTKRVDADEDEDYLLYIAFTASPCFLGRFFSELDENIKTGAFNIEHKIKTSSTKNLHLVLKAGVYIEKKNAASAQVISVMQWPTSCGLTGTCRIYRSMN